MARPKEDEPRRGALREYVQSVLPASRPREEEHLELGARQKDGQQEPEQPLGVHPEHAQRELEQVAAVGLGVWAAAAAGVERALRRP